MVCLTDDETLYIENLQKNSTQSECLKTGVDPSESGFIIFYPVEYV